MTPKPPSAVDRRPRVAILTPDPADLTYADRWPTLFARYVEVFAAEGAQVVAAPWIDGPVAGCDLHLASLAWGYHLNEPLWRTRLAAWPVNTPLLNTPRLLAWNTRKTYLTELEARGVAVVPTLFADQADDGAVAQARARFGAAAVLVVKPQVSAGSHATLRLAPGEPAPGFDVGFDRPVMIQPYLKSVEGEGELSLFSFGGGFAHAVAKCAAPGDFRVQPQFGGRFQRVEHCAEALALAEAALNACPEPPAYARIDMVRDDAGLWRLMELELIEPDLYFDHAEGGGRVFARAMLSEIGC